MYVEALDYSRALYEVMEEPTVVEAFDTGFKENGYAGAMLAAANLLADRADSVYSPAYDVARFYINAGRNLDALEWLEKGVDERDPNMPYVMQPLWDPITDEPRFKEVSRKVGLPE